MPDSTDILAVLKEAIEQYRPGGAFATARAKQLARKKATVIPGMEAQLVGRGLAGTTVGAAIPTRFEEEVAKPFETETEMLRSARLTESILAKAGILERMEAREAQSELAKKQMELQKQLAEKQITSQEYMNRLRMAQEKALAEMQMKARERGRAGAGGARQHRGAGVSGPFDPWTNTPQYRAGFTREGWARWQGKPVTGAAPVETTPAPTLAERLEQRARGEIGYAEVKPYTLPWETGATGYTFPWEQPMPAAPATSTVPATPAAPAAPAAPARTKAVSRFRQQLPTNLIPIPTAFGAGW